MSLGPFGVRGERPCPDRVGKSRSDLRQPVQPAILPLMTNTTNPQPNYRLRRTVVGIAAAVAVGALLALLLGFLNDRDMEHFGQYPATSMPMAHITTTNTPDGGCHEEDACWNPATMGTLGGYVCQQEPDGSVQIFTDTTGADPAGVWVDCPR